MEQELYHYGVLGMKWGIRRYQNANGSLTDAGKRHYGSGTDIGSSRRKTRALDAAEVSDKIERLSKRTPTEKRTAKIKQLQKAYKGLIKDLDVKEIEYGERGLKMSREAASVSSFGTMIGGPLFGIAASLGYQAIRFNFTAEGKEYAKLSKELNDLNMKAKLSKGK